MSNKLDRKITVGSVLKFTFPSIAMMVIMSLYSVVDGTFVANLIGTDAFSAVNIVYPLGSITLGLGAMFGAGITAIVSQKLGEGKAEEANKNLTFLVLCSVVLGVAVSVVSLIFLKPIIYLLGADERVYGYCYDYAFPLVFFFALNILQMQFQNLYVADGKPYIGLIATAVGGVINIVLDYVFIAKCGMGISGAAIATGIGSAVPALFGVAYFLWNKRGNLRFVKPKVNWRVLLHAVSNGSSEMVSFLSTSITTLLFNILLMRFAGPDGVAAIAILLYLDFVLTAISLGYSLGVAPMIGYNYGADRRDRLRKLFRLSVGLSAVAGTVLTAGSFLFAPLLTNIFADPGTVVFDLAVAGLKIYAFGYLFKGFNIFSSALFTAYGNGIVSAILSFLRTLVFLVAALLILSTLFGVTGVWYASPLAELLAFAMGVIFVAKYRKKYL